MIRVSRPTVIRSAETVLVIATALFLPLLVAAPLGTPLLVSIAGAAGLALRLARGQGFPNLLRPLPLVMAALLIWSAVSMVWSLDVEFSLQETVRIAGIWYVAVILLDCRDCLDATLRRRLARMALIGSLGAGMALTGFGIVKHLDLLPPRIRITHFNQGAVILSIIAGPLLSGLVKNRQWVAAALLSVLSITAIRLLEDATAHYILFALPLVAAAVFAAPKLALRSAAVLCLLVVLTAPLTFSHIIDSPFSQSFSELKWTAYHRLKIWEFVGTRIEEKPVLGWGMNSSRVLPGGKDEYRPGAALLPLHPHNGSLQLWVELGFPGALLGGLVLFLVWWLPSRFIPSRLTAAGWGMAGGAAFLAMNNSYGLWQEWWQASLIFVAFLALLQAPHPIKVRQL